MGAGGSKDKEKASKEIKRDYKPPTPYKPIKPGKNTEKNYDFLDDVDSFPLDKVTT